MSERSGIHVTAADSGWPTASAAEAQPHKPGDGTDGLPKATAVNNGVVTAEQEVVYIALNGGDATTEWTLTLDGQTTAGIALDADGDDVKTALVALSNVATGDLNVVGAAGGPYVITFLEAGAWGDVVPPITADPVGTDNVQTLTVTATEGTFTLDVNGQTTDDIAEDADSAAVEAAIEALSNVAPADVAVTGDAPHVITFSGALAEQQVTLTADDTDLAGGTAVVVNTTPGLTGPAVTVEVAAEGS